MAKFVIQCPNCGKYLEANNGFFANHVIQCTCGHLIDVKKDRMASMVCPKCGNTVVYDQAKAKNALCPVCGAKLITPETLGNMVEVDCPTCGCHLSVAKNASAYTCPVCKSEVDVQKELKKAQMAKEGMVSVLKYEGDNETFIWKHPIEDFCAGSQLIVHESQEAVFFRDGEALDTFGPGRYTLDTEKLPLLNKVYKLPTGGKEVFHSEVYFINLTTQMGVKWGTNSKVRMFDPASGLHVELGASGEFNIKAVDGRKLLLKVVGTTTGLGQNELMGDDYSITGMVGKFKSLVMTKVKSYLAKAIREENINILEVDERLDEISQYLKEQINPTLAEYGLMMPEFFVMVIQTPDDDPNFKRLKEQYAERYLSVNQEKIKKAEAELAQERKIVEATTGAKTEVIAAQGHADAMRAEAQAKADAMKIQGYTYQQETQRQVATEAVKNGGGQGGGQGGGIAQDLVGLGVGIGVAAGVVGTVKDAVTPVAQSAVGAGSAVGGTIAGAWECPNCHTKNITSAFCPNCGTKRPETPAPEPTTWECPECHTKGITSNFCPNCGHKKRA
jgi:membrane protease subunit (stomatin/prohibitin family)